MFVFFYLQHNLLRVTPLKGSVCKDTFFFGFIKKDNCKKNGSMLSVSLHLKLYQLFF